MGEMVEKSRVFVKNVTEVFGKADGGRFKCPRCKGNGLNSSHPFWDRNQSSASSEWCWFCEGVGVMPVIGLNGFMLGRCKPIINTKNSNPLPKLPMNMQLYLGKFPETKCKVKTYKPSMKLADLLHDPNQFPSWMNGANGEVSTSESSGDSSSLLTSSRIKSSETGVIQTGNRTPKFQVPISSRNLRQPIASASKTSPRRARGAPRRLGGSLFVTVRKTVSTSLSAPMRVSSPPKVHTSSRSGVLADSIPGTSRKSPLLRTPKGTRYPRGERNRVREEAEKEAFLRAYKFQNSPSETRSSPMTDPPGTDARQTGGEKIEHFINLSLGGTGLISGQDSWRRMTMSSRKIASDVATINQLAFGKVKDGLIRTPSLGKAF